MTGGEPAGAPTVIAYAVTRGENPVVLLASDEAVLTRLMALRLVAATPLSELPPGSVVSIREALLEERWPDAVLEWMNATGEVVDAYPSEQVWTVAELDDERLSFELRMAPIFEGTPDDAQ